MAIKLSPVFIKNLLKKPAKTVVREGNLWLEVGTGEKKVIHARFYYKNPGRKYRKLGTLDADCTAQQCKVIHADYIDMYTNWHRGISPELTDKQTEIERQHKEDELRRIDALKTVDDIWKDYFERKLEGKTSAPTRRYNYGKHIKKQIGSSPADHIERQTLIDLFHKSSEHGDTAGNTTRQILSAIGNYGFDNGYLSDSRRWARLPKNPSPPRTRLATDKELAWLLKKGSVLVRGGMFLGQRAWNHLKLEWNEIEEDWLTIPPHKFKTRIHHRVCVTKTSHEIFQESRERFEEGHRNFDSNWIFPGGKIGHHVREETGHKDFTATNVQSVQRKSEPVSLMMRDIRRNCYSFVEQNFSQIVSGAIAGHTKDAMHRVYGQYDYEKEKQAALLEWEKYLLGLM
jgi:hypothetical protein